MSQIWAVVWVFFGFFGRPRMAPVPRIPEASPVWPGTAQGQRTIRRLGVKPEAPRPKFGFASGPIRLGA